MSAGTRKVVINTCFGGFSLSARAVQRMAELQGRECYFFANPKDRVDLYSYERVSVDEADKRFLFHAYDIPDADKYLVRGRQWFEMSEDEKKELNDFYEKHSLDNRPASRHDPILVQVVEELGKAASGTCSDLTIVEIPADIEYTIEEYDGNEHIAEAHRTWR